MNQLPLQPLSPEEQQYIANQIYLLMGKQVHSYHKHRHMGNSSSVPLELAQELMESIEYTVNLVGGAYAHADLDKALVLGQEILTSRLRKAKSMLELVSGTAPQWQTECRWEALRYLQHYLDHYDPLHLAHEGPDALFYPILIAPPEDIRGIDSCLFYLNIMWIENQIMAAVPERALEQLYDRLPTAVLNQCEQLLINGIGKSILGAGIDPLVFAPEEYPRLLTILRYATEDTLQNAGNRLCHSLALKEENAEAYAKAILPQMRHWTGEASYQLDLGNLFL